jgi:pilus assembly protein CpaE
MIAELSAGHRVTEMFRDIAQQLTGRGEYKKPRRSFLTPLLGKLRRKKGNRSGDAAERRRAS